MRSGTGNTAEFKEDNMSIHVVVMGVAGCGKSTVAEAIHERLGYVYAEGDDFHPQANIDKMSAGIPLTDEDRWPWLKVINTWMVAREALDENTVVSSSALKRSYREVLAQNVPTFFVHLTGSQELIQQRLNERKGHFMPPALLPSQFAILEPLQPDENGVEVSIEGSVEEMVERAVAAAVDQVAVALGGSHEHARAVKVLCNQRFGRLGAKVAEEDDEGIAVRGLDVGDGLEHVGFVLDGDGTFVHAALTSLGDVRAAHFGERAREAVTGDGDEAELYIGDVFKHDTFPP